MSGEGITKLIRSDLAAFGGYVPSKAPEILAERVKMDINGIVKLDANENLYGCSPRVNKALGDYPYLNIYPDAGQTEIRRLLAGYTGVDAEHIVVGNGSDELIGLIIRLFLEPGDEVINCVPTFDMFRFGVILCNGKLVEVPRDEDYRVDVKAVKKAITKKTKLILLANPNNPTGTPTPRQDVLELIETGVPVLADEAYVEFSGETVTHLVPNYDNLIVLRTFSKWAGLAGLRVGYGLMHPKIVGYLQTIKQPYNVNIAARVAVRESLEDVDHLMKNVKAIVAERERLFNELSKLVWLKPFPSKANFVFCHVLNGKAAKIQQELENRGILIRYFDIPRLQNSLRISVGRPDHTDALIKALKEVGGD
ncbi:MAG: histidinol-phosphate transaminase [Chloroflexi bacterium RBG_13_56_8b]|nr:MAG: histidinol-phosphate transaminase [Chloroflexi bacterium RBG_13_56_8b]